MVTEYFSATKRINTLKSEIEAANTGEVESDLASLEAELNRLQEPKMALEDTVGRIIEKQITETLTQHGIFNPIDKYIRLKVNFPPVYFKLEKPPHLLLVSPRDRIENIRTITLR